MTMAKHVIHTCRTAYYHLHNIASIRRSLTTSACKIIVHSLVISRLDFGNATLYGISDALLHRLQVLQNSAARLITGTRRREHISPVLFALHWLPIRQRIKFKLLALVYRCLHQLAPAYLSDLIIPYTPARSLRSADSNLITNNRYHLEGCVRRRFSVAGPFLLNKLPATVKSANSLCITNSPFSRSIHDTVVSLLVNHPNIQTDYYCTLVVFIFYLRIFTNVFLFIAILLPQVNYDFLKLFLHTDICIRFY